jgi:2'-5' RNA ligase
VLRWSPLANRRWGKPHLTGHAGCVPRLFLTLWLPDHATAALEELHRKDAKGVRFVPPENWHVTLRFLGTCEPGDAVAAVDGARLPAASARLGPAVDLLRRDHLVVPVKGIDELAAAVVKATSDIGDPPPKRAFFGHVTLARLKKHADMPRVLGDSVSAEWPVREVALVQSRLHPDGARYETLTTWPVGSAEL